MKTTLIEVLVPGSMDCPECGANLDATTGQGEPSPDDCSVCVYCGTALTFQADLTLRRMTPEEVVRANEETNGQLATYQELVRRGAVQ